MFKLDYTYGTTDNNGNVKSQTITVPTVGATPGFVATQNYTYDSLNRIKQATETIPSQTGWQQTFVYDRYGNRRFDTTPNATTTLDPNCPVAVCNPQIDPSNNKLIGYGFDASGNTNTDANGRTYIYDSENKQVQVNEGPTIVGQYFYDGDGKRIKKIVPNGETTVFVYDASGKTVAEYSTQLNPTPQVSYLTTDHLGSPRINTDASGAVIARHDYHPFGEEVFTNQRTQVLGYAADTVRQKFTTYERDNESQLDFAKARYHNFNLGRFQSPDPIFISRKRIRTPQLWNSYSYAGNNPLKYVDPDGLERIKLGDSEDKVKKDLEEAKNKKKEIEKDKSLSKDDRKKQLTDQKAKINTLDKKLEGTRTVNSILKVLDKAGERNGLQLSDFELTTDGKNDFSGLDAANQKKILGAQAFTNVPNEGNTIFIRTETPDGFYYQAQTNRDFIYYGASALSHEQYHTTARPGHLHSEAFQRQKDVLIKFRFFYQNSLLYDLHLQGVDDGVNGKYN